MSEEEVVVEEEVQKKVEDKKEEKVDVQKLVQEGVDNALAGIKVKLDSAFAARDEALKKVAEFEQAKREAEVEALKAAGKNKEAYELELLEKTEKFNSQIAEEKAKREAIEKKNIKLTRDAEVKSHFSTLVFRSDKATNMAFKEIVDELVLDESGNWMHKSGVNIADYIKAFSAHEDNAFLFKQKVSSGSGTTQLTRPSDGSEKKSLFKMSQAEVLKLAEAGKLR